MDPYFKIFNEAGDMVAVTGYIEDDPNNGLPDWFFKGTFFDLYIDEDQNHVEWVPPMGPAPCWKETLTQFVDDADMFRQFNAWAEITYFGEKVMEKTKLDAIPAAELLSLPIEIKINGFNRDDWKAVWVEAAEAWFEDGGAMYDYIVNGFKGWAARTDFEIYCDLRLSYFEGKETQTWDDLFDYNRRIGKYS